MKETMTSRQRVLTALAHREADRVPIDLGGMDSTTIMGAAYTRLKRHLGIAGGSTRIYAPELICLVEEPVRRWARADVVPIPLLPHEWRPWTLSDGSPCEIPARWNPEQQADGSWIVRDPASGQPALRMPAGGFFFDAVNPPLAGCETIADLDAHAADFESADWPFWVDDTFDDLRERGRRLRQETDAAIMGNFAVHIFAGGQSLRGYDTFMMDLLLNPKLAEAIMDRLAEAYIRRFDHYIEAVGPYVDIINVNDDLGQQDRLLISPKTYRTLVKPYQKKIYDYIHRKTSAQLFLHSDGSIRAVIPDLIEIGVQILNPCQFTAAGMDSAELKREFGKELTFWGAGVDTQTTLPRGTPQQVRDEVRRQLDILMPGGGYVFNTVHNILHEVPPENIVAMYEAVWEYGKY
jgi:uroporphyrinogen decarboxylase